MELAVGLRTEMPQNSLSDGAPAVPAVGLPKSVLRYPSDLRLHAALSSLEFVATNGGPAAAPLVDGVAISEPILITTTNIIVKGFERWRQARLDGEGEVSCLEYPLDDDQALEFILQHQVPTRGWNAFDRIRAALTLEPKLQAKALANMRLGGRNKGLANLPTAELIDVRKELARIAGTGMRNVGNVKRLIRDAHPKVISALHEGILSIHAAMQLCICSKHRQPEELAKRIEARESARVITAAMKSWTNRSSMATTSAISLLQEFQASGTHSVLVKTSRCRNPVLLFPQHLQTIFPKEST